MSARVHDKEKKKKKIPFSIFHLNYRLIKWSRDRWEIVAVTT